MNANSYSLFEIDIKRFKKGKKINKGGFGIIYSVQEKETGQLYAAKVVNCDDDEAQCRKMIDREIGIMVSTNHPTIIKFIGYSLLDFQEENNITLIMDLAKNGSLFDIIKRIQNHDGPKDYTNTTRLIIMTGVARGMKYLHDHNIIHRDLKLANILLDENYYPHITDFGMSKFFESGHSKSQTIFGGTLSYMAPEIIKNEQYDQKADVYSFGILMYQVVTDLAAYPNLESGEMTEFEFINKVVNENYRPEFKIPIKKTLQDLIKQCWSNEPSLRPTFSEIFNKFKELNKTKEEENNESMLLDDVDAEEFGIYLEKIDEFDQNDNDSKELNNEDIIQLKKQLIDLKWENDLLKKNTVISTFNSYPLKIQNLVVSCLISIDEKNEFLNKINNLIQFLLSNFIESANYQCLKIICNDDSQNLVEIDKKFQLQFQTKSLQLLQNSDSFNSDEFSGILKKFNDISLIIDKSINLPLILNSKSFNYYNVPKVTYIYEGEIEIKNKSNIQNLIIQNSVTSIEGNLFNNFNSLVNIVIPSSVNTIGKNAFSNCYNLTEVSIPSVEFILPNAFYNCSSLKCVTLNKAVLIGDFSFSKCTSLERIVIPSSTNSLGKSVFQGCTNLKDAEIPSSVTSIGESAFDNCSSLINLVFNASVKTIEARTFQKCKSLKYIAIPSVFIIGESAFEYCSSLESVGFSQSLFSIEKNAFNDCNSLKILIIPSSVSKIKSNTFNGCSSLINVFVAKSTATESSSFYYKTNIIKY